MTLIILSSGMDSYYIYMHLYIYNHGAGIWHRNCRHATEIANIFQSPPVELVRVSVVCKGSVLTLIRLVILVKLSIPSK